MTASSDIQFVLLRAVRRVLRPLVRILLSNRIGFRQASELLKQVYIDAAREDVAGESGEGSTSRLSLYTGIHRKEVKRLRRNELETLEVPRSVAQGAPILEAWSNDSRYLDRSGRPRPLPRASTAEGEASFDDLVRSVQSDVHTRTVLDEWLRLGLVFERADGRIELVQSAFVPSEGLREKLFYFERNLHDHLGVAQANLTSPKDSMFERSLHLSGLPDASVRELESLARQQGMRALEKVNRRARELRAQARDGAEPTPAEPASGSRINFGLFFFRDAERDEKTRPRDFEPGGPDDHA